MTRVIEHAPRCEVGSEVYLDDQSIELDDMGNEFEACPMSGSGHLFLTQCGETVCVHCKRIAWR